MADDLMTVSYYDRLGSSTCQCVAACAGCHGEACNDRERTFLYEEHDDDM